MNKYLKYIFSSLARPMKILFFLGAVYSLLFVFILVPRAATAVVNNGLEDTANCAYGNGTIDSSGKCDGAARTGITKKGALISNIAGTITGAVLGFVGVLFFILMVYGGFLWMTSAGNEQQVEKAQNLIIAAVIGLIIIMSAYAITAYIGGALTG